MQTESTQIFFTPPGGTQTQIQTYDSCDTTRAGGNRTGSFSISVRSFDDSLIDTYPIGTDVLIKQGDSWFRGYIKDPPKSLFATIRTVIYSGVSYAGLTQRLFVNESYIDTRIDTIVKALFHKYLPTIGHETYITACATLTSIDLNDVKLFDALEQLAERAGYNWAIDQASINVSTLELIFYDPSTNTATATISETENQYERGSASFSSDTQKLVNRLIVKVNNADVDGDLYNIRMVLDDADSQTLYGIYEEIYTPKATYINDIIALAQAYLDKYKAPIKSGALKPLYGDWEVDQKVNIDIPSLNEDAVYTISQVTLSSAPMSPVVERSLTFTQAPRDYADVVKKINDRLESLETKLSDTITNFNPLFYYVYSTFADNFYWDYVSEGAYPSATSYTNDEIILSLSTSAGEIYRVAFTDLTYNGSNDITYGFTIDAGDATGIITKMALYSKGATATLGTGTLLSSQITNINKTAATVFKIDWRIKQS